MDESDSIFKAPTDNDLPRRYREALSQLEEHFSADTFGICCKKFSLIKNAQDVTIEEHIIYIANLCTLLERRWPTKKSLPYNGNESCPNRPEGDILHDYQFDPPGLTVLSQSSRSLCKDLDQTRRQEECLQCQNDEQVPCSHCNGRRYVVTWIQVNVQWFNNTSKIVFSSNNQSTCAQSIIDSAPNKVQCLEFDDIWPSYRTTLDDILETCHDLPEGLRIDMNKKFLEHQRADKILRLKCTIERVRIEKITYCLTGTKDETFTFYLVGEEKQLRTVESSYPSHSEQCKVACSLM